MKVMTLREVCSEAEVSRRAIQGYEKAGLVCAYGKNERGYLLYDNDAQERIKQIKFFQQLGFSIKEIVGIIDAPNHVLKRALKEQVTKLQEEGQYREVLIVRANKLIESL